MIVSKIRARWIHNQSIFKQFYVSALSYLKNPFCRKYKGATRQFFIKNYYDRPDELVFDGNNNAYFDKLHCCGPLNSVHFNTIYDCGCGNGSFLDYIERNHFIYEKYIGVDFAKKNQHLSPKADIVCSDVSDFDYSFVGNTMMFFSNVFCYLSDDQIIKIVDKIKNNVTFGKCVYVVILEPVPGIFWDATFDGVKLYYRKMTALSAYFSGFIVGRMSTDYLFCYKKKYFFPLSYACIMKITGLR